MTVEKGFKLFILAQKSIEHFLCRQGCGHWQITTRQAFGEAEKIRLHTFMMAGE